MIVRTRFLLAALLASGGAAPALAEPPLIPPDLQPYVARNITAYFVGFLVAPGQPHPMSRDLFIRHQNYMRSQFEAGVYRLAGRFSDSGHIAGMVILSARNAEEARAIVTADPAVGEGALAVEIHPSIFPDLSSLRVEYSPRP
jgi:uncharacterized protein YciI